MAMTDRYGNTLSTKSDAARQAYDEGLDLFLSVNWGAREAFERATAADPRFALAHVGVARASMMAGDMTAARAALAKAEAVSEAGDARERAHIGIFATLLAGRAAEARHAVRAHVQDYPRDALIAQLCTSVFGLIGFSGEVGREAELLAFTENLMPHYADDWWMESMHAISLCETGQLGASEALMEKALTANPRNANGAHFKAHALYEVGRVAEGRAYLADWMPAYDRRAPLHGHISWHGALWALHDGEEDAMWAAVDDAVGPGTGQSLPINVLTDTASILHRASLAGIEVDAARWRQVSDYAAQHFPNPGQSFADMHAALAHAMAGDGERLARLTEGAKGFAGDLVAPVARAWGAVARGAWTDALDDLLPALAQTERFGGSRAQRDLLELTYVDVLLKLGRSEEAERALALRRPVLAAA